MNERYDVITVGGGPAGSTAAAALAQAGCRVALCERESFPRFHIGESLLPAGNSIFHRIGVWDRIEASGFMRKAGAEFETADGESHVHNIFAKGLLPGNDYTYQVERSRFDTILLEHARECGATVRQPVQVVAAVEDGDGWTVELSDGARLAASFLIDASGRANFLARSARIGKVDLPYARKIAFYAHYRGVERAPGEQGGNILITRWRDGWFWEIPLDAERTSVGLVATLQAYQEFAGDAEAFFAAAVQATPVVAKRLAAAGRIGDRLHTTTDYTYMYERFAGERFLLAGDAACFIDPVFSSGVYLAMQSGWQAASLIAGAVRRNRPLSRREQARYNRFFHRRVKVMRGLIDTFYDVRGIEVFLSPTDRLQLFAAVNSVVAGNTHLPWRLRWRYQLFLWIVALHRRTRRIVPALELDPAARPG